MIHEWPEGRSNPAGNQEASHLRSSVCTKGSSVAATGAAPAAAATWRSARTGLSMHIGNKLAVIESVRSLHATKGRLPSTIRPSVLLNFFFVFYSSFFVFFLFLSSPRWFTTLALLLYTPSATRCAGSGSPVRSMVRSTLHWLKYAARCELV